MKVWLSKAEAVRKIRGLNQSSSQFEREAAVEVFSFCCSLLKVHPDFDKEVFRKECFE